MNICDDVTVPSKELFVENSIDAPIFETNCEDNCTEDGGPAGNSDCNQHKNTSPDDKLAQVEESSDSGSSSELKATNKDGPGRRKKQFQRKWAAPITKKGRKKGSKNVSKTGPDASQHFCNYFAPGRHQFIPNPNTKTPKQPIAT